MGVHRDRFEKKLKIAVWIAIGVIAVLGVRSWRYHRFRSACVDIEPRTSVVDAQTKLSRAGGRLGWKNPNGDPVWMRARLSLKYQRCTLSVEGDRVTRTLYEDAWDLL